MEYDDQQKIKIFNREWGAYFGAIWSDNDEQDVYHSFAKENDIILVVKAIRLLAKEKVKNPRMAELTVYYDKIKMIKAREQRYQDRDIKPPKCDMCNDTGLAWVVYLDEADLCPCECEWGAKKNRDYFDDGMPMAMIAQRLKEMHRFGSFKTKDEAEVVLKGYLEKIEREGKEELQKQGEGNDQNNESINES